jgi:hypothetical protein
MRIKLRCATCGGKCGPGVKTATVWKDGWFRRVNFCTDAHHQAFLRNRAEEMERKRAVGLLFRPP